MNLCKDRLYGYYVKLLKDSLKIDYIVEDWGTMHILTFCTNKGRMW